MIAAPIMLFPLLPLMLFLVILPVGLLTTAFWIWMLVSAAQNKGLDENEKIVWVLIVALLHFLGAVIYFFAAHHRRQVPLPLKAT